MNIGLFRQSIDICLRDGDICEQIAKWTDERRLIRYSFKTTMCSRVHTTKATIDDASTVVLLHDALQRQICKNRHRILFIEFNCFCYRGRRCGGRCRRACIGDIACWTRCAIVAAMIKTFATHWLPTKHMSKILVEICAQMCSYLWRWRCSQLEHAFVKHFANRLFTCIDDCLLSSSEQLRMQCINALIGIENLQKQTRDISDQEETAFVGHSLARFHP